MDVIVDGIDFVFPDDGNGRLRGELFRARPTQAPVPSHGVGTRNRATTMGGDGVKGISEERSVHALSRSRIFEMKFDGRGEILTTEDEVIRGWRLG